MKKENLEIIINFPSWDDFPDIGLYMDQVLVLMEKYIGSLLITENKEGFLTPSMINNYVKNKVLPAPIGKKYSKEHLAYLIIICLMKQALSISSIKNIIEIELKNITIEELYNKFCKYYFNSLNAIINNDSISLTAKNDIDNVLKLGIISNICRIISDQELVRLTKTTAIVVKEKNKKEKKKEA